MHANYNVERRVRKRVIKANDNTQQPDVIKWFVIIYKILMYMLQRNKMLHTARTFSTIRFLMCSFKIFFLRAGLYKA